MASGLDTRTWAGFPDAGVARISGVLTADSRRLPDGRRVDLCRITGVHNREGMYASAGGRVTVFSRDDTDLYTGTTVDCRGTLLRTEEGDCLFFASSGGVEVTGGPAGLYRLRVSLLHRAVGIFSALDERTAGLVQALFLGVRDDLQDQRVFRRAGCSHLLALSGMHVGIITGFLSLLLLPALGKRTSLIVLYGIILSYLFLTGFGASLNRSAVMFFLLSFPAFFSKKPPALQVLGLSFVILAVAVPASTATLSFQLSFLALGGILTVGKLVLPALCRLPGFLRYALAASLGAQAATAPLVLAVFGVVYPVGIAASIVLTPVVTVIMGLGMVYLALSAAGLSFLAGPLGRGIGAASRLLYVLAEQCARVPGIRVEEGRWWYGAAVSAIIIILFFMYGVIRKRRFPTGRGYTL